LSAAIGWVAEARERLAQDTRTRLEKVAISPAQLKTQLDDLGWDNADKRLKALDDEGRVQLSALLHAQQLFPTIAPAATCREWMNKVVDAMEAGGSAALQLLEASRIAPQSRRRLREELLALFDRAEDQDGLEDDLKNLLARLAASFGLGSGRKGGLFARLLELEVVSEALAPSGHEHDQNLELLRINAEAPCALDGRSLPHEKLTGLGLGHFAAFYKRSWRANDWLWGRLDGAARLVDILVDPRAIRLRIEGDGGIDGVLETLLKVARGRSKNDPAFLEARFRAKYHRSLEHGVSEELRQLREWTLEDEPPTQLPLARDAIRAALQLEIAREELPVVARAAVDDVQDEQAAPDAAGRRWADQRAHLFIAPLAPQDVVDSLTQLRIAETETFVGEIGSDLLTRNVATTATVAASALAATRSGLPRGVRAVPLALRGTLLALYGLTWSLTSPRRALKTMALVGLLLALVVVVWGVVAEADVPDSAPTASGTQTGEGSASPPGWLSALAKVIVAGGILLGVLRGGTAGIGVGVAALIAYAAIRVSDRWPRGAGEVLERGLKDEPIAMAAVAIVAAGLLTGLVAGRGPLSRLFLASAPARRAAAASGIRLGLMLLYAIGVAAVVEVGWDLVDEPQWSWPAAVGVVAVVAVVAGVARWQTRTKAGPEGVRRILVVGGEQGLAPVLRNLLEPDIAVRHRGRPAKGAQIALEADVARTAAADSRIVLIRPSRDVEKAYLKRAPNRVHVVGGRRWRVPWLLSLLRRLILGAGDDGFSAARALKRPTAPTQRAPEVTTAS
jgi:hypothetical protein